MQGVEIVSDGTIEGTQIFLDEAAQVVRTVRWRFSPTRQVTTLTIEIANVVPRASPRRTRERLDALLRQAAPGLATGPAL